MDKILLVSGRLVAGRKIVRNETMLALLRSVAVVDVIAIVTAFWY
jgi:hypothetical protein